MLGLSPILFSIPSFMCLSWALQASSSLAVCPGPTRTQAGSPIFSHASRHRGHQALGYSTPKPHFAVELFVPAQGTFLKVKRLKLLMGCDVKQATAHTKPGFCSSDAEKVLNIHFFFPLCFSRQCLQERRHHVF